MYEVTVKIKGVTPLLMHKMNTSAIDPAGKTTAASITEDNPADFLYTTEDGTVCLPAVMFERAMMEAGKEFKVSGKRGRNYSTMFGSMVYVLPENIVLSPSKWVADKRTVVIPSRQGSRIVRIRPRFDEWGASFNIQVRAEKSELPEAILKQVIDRAGLYIGVGDFRPQKKGKFGQFIVTEFNVKKT